LTCIDSDINLYNFLTGTVRFVRYRTVRYDIHNAALDYIEKRILKSVVVDSMPKHLFCFAELLHGRAMGNYSVVVLWEG